MKQYGFHLKIMLLVGVIYMPLLGHLDSLPIRIWDEARLAVNAYEMHKNGNFIVTHFGGVPEMWSTKPPLQIWCQVFFMKLLGVNELAVRLPAAIAAFFTCILLPLFTHRYLKNFWLGFIAVVVMVTSKGFVNLHASRTGDYDSLLTLFSTLSGLLFFAYSETRNYKYLYLFFLFTTLAVLTKSVAGLLFVPALFLYSLNRKEFVPLLKSKHFYLGALFFVVSVGGYYLLREAYNPGYIAAVRQNELGGRYFEVIENHKHSFWFYYNISIADHLSSWYLLLPCGVALGLVIKNEKINRLSLFLLLMCVVYFLVISSSQTKLLWYDMPMYPFLALLIAIFIFHLFDWLQNLAWLNETLSVNVMPFLFLFLIGAGPYQKILETTYMPQRNDPDKEFYEIGHFLKAAVKGDYNLHNQFLLYDGYNAQNLFYLNILNDKGYKISFKDWKNLSPSDIVIACQNEVKQYVEAHYEHEIIQRHGAVVTYKIGEKIGGN